MRHLTCLRAFALSLLLIVSLQSLADHTATAQSRRLVQQTSTVSAGNYVYVRFDIGRDGAIVSGRFYAQGGSGNDIKVLVLDTDGFENWRNGHSTPTYYNSGQVTVGSINIRLAQGTYYLIYANTFSLVTNKVVTADIFIESAAPAPPSSDSPYRSRDTSRDMAEAKFDRNHDVVGLANLMSEEDISMYGHDTHAETGRIIKLLYDETEIIGCRLQLPDGSREDVKFDPNRLPNSDRGWLPSLFKVGRSVKVVFVVVGSGQFWMPDEIYLVRSQRQRR